MERAEPAAESCNCGELVWAELRKQRRALQRKPMFSENEQVMEKRMQVETEWSRP